MCFPIRLEPLSDTAPKDTQCDFRNSAQQFSRYFHIGMAPTKGSFEGSDEERLPLNDYNGTDSSLTEQRYPRSGLARPAKASLIWVVALVFVTSIATAIATALVLRPTSAHCYHVDPSTSSIPPAHQAPSFNHQLVVFNPDKRFLGPPTPSTERSWQSLLPLGRGFVHASDREDNTPQQYSIAAFHQFHCVHLLQRIFHRSVKDPLSITLEDREHFYHCVDYLRQTVLCLEDPSLDRVTEDLETPGRALNSGWGDTHVCRDFGALKRWTEDRRATNATFPDSF
jgi:hypothetical protein